MKYFISIFLFLFCFQNLFAQKSSDVELNSLRKQLDTAKTLNFDKALEIYPDFSEVQCYKAECLRRLGKIEEGNELTIKCQENAKMGNTINEDNSKYELYPFQIRWWN